VVLGGFGEVMVLDWGLAKWSVSQITSQLACSFFYAAEAAKWTCAQLGRLVKGETPST
jgi:hypothetical protein